MISSTQRIAGVSTDLGSTRHNTSRSSTSREWENEGLADESMPSDTESEEEEEEEDDDDMKPEIFGREDIIWIWLPPAKKMGKVATDADDEFSSTWRRSILSCLRRNFLLTIWAVPQILLVTLTK